MEIKKERKIKEQEKGSKKRREKMQNCLPPSFNGASNTPSA
jgi:hypothetical protein